MVSEQHDRYLVLLSLSDIRPPMPVIPSDLNDYVKVGQSMERKVVDEWPIDAKYTAVKFSDDTYGLKQFIANKGNPFEDDIVVLYSPKIDSMRCFETSEHLAGIRKFVEFLDDVVVKEGNNNGKSENQFQY